MADALFVDESGTPYGGSNPQNGPTTILNYHPIIIDLILEAGETRLEGEVWVENAMVATFDTNLDPVFSFLHTSGDASNNQFFVQNGDRIKCEIQKINGSAVSTTTKELEINRLQPPNIASGKTLTELSPGRFSSYLLQEEFSVEFSLNEFTFIKEVIEHINLELSTAGYGYQTPASEQELSMGRRVQRIKDWVDF